MSLRFDMRGFGASLPWAREVLMLCSRLSMMVCSAETYFLDDQSERVVSQRQAGTLANLKFVPSHAPAGVYQVTRLHLQPSQFTMPGVEWQRKDVAKLVVLAVVTVACLASYGFRKTTPVRELKSGAASLTCTH